MGSSLSFCCCCSCCLICSLPLLCIWLFLLFTHTFLHFIAFLFYFVFYLLHIFVFVHFAYLCIFTLGFLPFPISVSYFLPLSSGFLHACMMFSFSLLPCCYSPSLPTTTTLCLSLSSPCFLCMLYNAPFPSFSHSLPHLFSCCAFSPTCCPSLCPFSALLPSSTFLCLTALYFLFLLLPSLLLLCSLTSSSFSHLLPPSSFCLPSSLHSLTHLLSLALLCCLLPSLCPACRDRVSVTVVGDPVISQVRAAAAA